MFGLLGLLVLLEAGDKPNELRGGREVAVAVAVAVAGNSTNMPEESSSGTSPSPPL